MLWDTAVCFFHIQEIGTNVRDPNTYNTPPEVELESCKISSKKNSVLKQSMFAILSLVSNNIALSVMFRVVELFKRAYLLPEASFHMVTDLARKLSVYNKSGLPIPAKDKHLKTVFAQESASSPRLLKSYAKRFRQPPCWRGFFRKFTISFNTGFGMSFLVLTPRCDRLTGICTFVSCLIRHFIGGDSSILMRFCLNCSTINFCFCLRATHKN